VRILVASDSASSRDAVIRHVSDRHFDAGTVLELVGVVHSEIPRVPDPAFAMVAAHEEQMRRQREELPSALEAGARRFRQSSPSADISWKVIEGPPADVILREAERWNATFIVVGAADRGALAESLAPSTADIIAAHATVPVEIVVGAA
jgi:nucleotide-binding universal stress UspA family protein